MGIFDKRVAFKPFEYPEVLAYKDAINHSYWLVSEWNFLGDIHDFNVRLDDKEKHAVRNTLLAISQIEVSVKRFWTRLGDRFPKAEFEQVGVTMGECFVDGTEILTPDGWVNLGNIQVGDEVLQFHHDNTLSITQVRHKTDQEYSGKMIRFHKKTTETVVTPNHRMVYYDSKGNCVEATAENLNLKNQSNKLPEAAKLKGGTQTVLPFIDRLRVAIQANGHRRYHDNGYGRHPRPDNGLGAEYEVRIQKVRKIKRLDWILENLKGCGVIFSKNPISSKPGMFCYTIRIDAEYDYKEFKWVNLHDKTAEWCLDFIEEIAEWAGQRLSHKDCKIRFSTTNKTAADAAQMVGVGAGYRTNMSTAIDKRKEFYKDFYIVSFTKNRERVSLKLNRSDIPDYSGMVRCVTVDSGAIITRYKNKTFISKNSEIRHADAYSHLLEVLGLNDDFVELLENPVIQGRVEYLTKYLKGAAENSAESFTLTLTLFSIFIENVSLFSQFLVIKSFDKYMNIMKDIDNVVQATLKEEHVHALMGVYIIKQIQKEHPEWFNEDFYAKLQRACKKANEAEGKIIDWIFEAGELPFLPKDLVKEFVKKRFNDSMQLIGGEPVFDVDLVRLEQLKWFDDEILAEVNTDFFHKKPTTYSKKVQAIKAEDIF